MAKDPLHAALDHLSGGAESNEEQNVEPKEDLAAQEEETVAQDTAQDTAQDKEVLEHTEKETIESSESETAAEQSLELDDDRFLQWASEKLERKVESLDDLVLKETVEKEKEYLSEFAEGYDKFYRETNRSPQDYLKLQRDLSVLPKDEVIKESLKVENPTLSDAQIDRLYNRKYNIDEDMMEESEIEDVKLDIDIAYNRGLKTLESEKEKYAAPKDNSIASLEAQAEQKRLEAEEAARQWSESIAKANETLGGIEIDLGEDFKFTHPISPEAKKTVKEISQDGSMQKWFQKYQMEDGSIDQVLLQRDVYIRDNWQKLLTDAVKQAQGRTVEAISKEDKNIDFKSGSKPESKGALSDRARQDLELLKRKGRY